MDREQKLTSAVVDLCAEYSIEEVVGAVLLAAAVPPDLAEGGVDALMEYLSEMTCESQGG